MRSKNRPSVENMHFIELQRRDYRRNRAYDASYLAIVLAVTGALTAFTAESPGGRLAGIVITVVGIVVAVVKWKASRQ